MCFARCLPECSPELVDIHRGSSTVVAQGVSVSLNISSVRLFGQLLVPISAVRA